MPNAQSALAITGGYAMSGLTALLAQVPDLAPQASAILQYGALGILGASTAGLFYVILRLMGAQKELADRWDGWEKIRHADSENMRDTLTQLSVNCANKNNRLNG